MSEHEGSLFFHEEDIRLVSFCPISRDDAVSGRYAQGDVHVLATHEQIFCPAYRFVGASFPQSSVPHAALAAAATAVGESAARAGVSGFVGVDFVVFTEDGTEGGGSGAEGTMRLWAVDLNVRPTRWGWETGERDGDRGETGERDVFYGDRVF